MKFMIMSGHIFELVEAIVQRLGDATLRFLATLLDYDSLGAVAMCDDIAYNSGLGLRGGHSLRLHDGGEIVAPGSPVGLLLSRYCLPY
jgi:hypothetical protein